MGEGARERGGDGPPEQGRAGEEAEGRRAPLTGHEQAADRVAEGQRPAGREAEQHAQAEQQRERRDEGHGQHESRSPHEGGGEQPPGREPPGRPAQQAGRECSRDRVGRDQQARGRGETVAPHPELGEVQGQDRREGPADEVHEEEDHEQRQDGGQAHHVEEARAGGGRGVGRGPRRLLVEPEHEDEGDRTEAGGDHERPADADLIGQEAAREGPDGRREDLRGLDHPHRERSGHGEAEGPDPSEEPDPDPERQQLDDAGHRSAGDEQDHVGHQRLHRDPLLTVAVGQAAPDRRQEAREEGGDADQRPRPQGGPLLVLDPELADVEGKEGEDEGEAGEDHEDRGHHHVPGGPRSSGSREQPDLAHGEDAVAHLEGDPGAARRATAARDFGGAGAQLHGRSLPEGHHDVAPAHPAAPAGAEGLAGRFLARDREGEGPRALSGGGRQAGRFLGVHQLGHEALAPARQGRGHARQLDQVDPEAHDHSGIVSFGRPLPRRRWILERG